MTPLSLALLVGLACGTTQSTNSKAADPGVASDSIHIGTTVPLSGTVEADETYIGGKHHRGQARALENKTMVVGALQRGGNVRLKVELRQASTVVLREFLETAVADEAEAIYTDQAKWYDGIEDENTRHESVDHSAEEWVRGDVGTQGIESAWSHIPSLSD